MCELFAVCAKHEVIPNEWLRGFFSHDEKNPHGWGMAVFYGSGVPSIEKEPEKASVSNYLTARLRHDIHTTDMIAHIRRATLGTPEYANTHPFVMRDESGRCWTLAHNGAIFEESALRPYVQTQDGKTDSERILCYIVDQANLKARQCGHSLSTDGRCALIDEVARTLSEGNKLNFVLFDGEILYVHSNHEGTLYRCDVDGSLLFATAPFPTGTLATWEEMPQRTLCAYARGEQVFQGTQHAHVFIEDPEKMQSLFMAFAEL